MNPTQQLKSFRNELLSLVERADHAIAESEAKEDNPLLSKHDAEKVMGYQSGYFKQMDVQEAIPFEDGCIRFKELWEWAKRNRNNRLKKMRKNKSLFI